MSGYMNRHTVVLAPDPALALVVLRPLDKLGANWRRRLLRMEMRKSVGDSRIAEKSRK